MTVRVKIFGSEYTIKESIKNVKKTFEMQRDFISLSKNAESDDASKAIDANLDGIERMVTFILDMVSDKKLTSDVLEEELSYEALGKLVQEIITKILHVEESEKNSQEDQEKE